VVSFASVFLDMNLPDSHRFQVASVWNRIHTVKYHCILFNVKYISYRTRGIISRRRRVAPRLASEYGGLVSIYIFYVKKYINY